MKAAAAAALIKEDMKHVSANKNQVKPTLREVSPSGNHARKLSKTINLGELIGMKVWYHNLSICAIK